MVVLEGDRTVDRPGCHPEVEGEHHTGGSERRKQRRRNHAEGRRRGAASVAGNVAEVTAVMEELVQKVVLDHVRAQQQRQELTLVEHHEVDDERAGEEVRGRGEPLVDPGHGDADSGHAHARSSLTPHRDMQHALMAA